jgi:pimeloyl-ACP methyl ester carboxylesterase
VALVTAVTVSAGTASAPDALAAPPGTTAAAAGARHVGPAREVVAPVPTLSWTRCRRAFMCATAIVPLDYDLPRGATIELNLLKRPANEPDARLGSLFVNPGGPGGPSTEVVDDFAGLLGKPVRDHYDVIGVDPRGIGGSTPVSCTTDVAAPPFPRSTVPLNLKQAKPLLRFTAWERHACATGGNAILDHMTTADTARDMDLIRQAVGDDQLHYYGVSYGTYLGATYAALFPDRVGAMILDGVLDPISWSTGRPGFERLPFSTRLKSGVGAWDALTTAFNQCDRVSKRRCVLSGSSTQKWLRIVHRLRKGPVKTTRFGRISYSDVISGTLGGLYRRSEYVFLMRDINRLYRQLFVHPRATAKLDLGRVFRRRAESAPGPYGMPLAAMTRRSALGAVATTEQLSPGFEGVACADSVNPSNPRAWLEAGRIADAQGPWFGRAWTWASSPCARWPGSSQDAYLGPWHHRITANPILIVGNFHDPATPIAGARTVNKLFIGSRMFSLNTWGHGAIGQSSCVTRRFDSYLVEGRLPLPGLVCQPDEQLFPIRG